MLVACSVEPDASTGRPPESGKRLPLSGKVSTRDFADRAGVSRPTVANYFGRITKARILESVREAKGEQAVQLIDHLKKPGFVVVDARAKAFYDGAQTGGSTERPHKTGHIEGALNVPFSEMTNGQSQFKSVEQLKTLFDAAGVKPGDTVVAYCHLGQQATATIFGAKLLGYPVLLYDGSFEEWSRLPNAPVVNPTVKK